MLSGGVSALRSVEAMEIAVMSGAFPSVSETFVLNQITGLLDMGHVVHPISLSRPKADQPRHDLVSEYSLEQITTVLNPHSKWARLAMAPVMAGVLAVSAPRTLRGAIDVDTYGRHAASGRLLEQAYYVLRSGVVNALDCVVCHFGPVGAEAVALRDIGAFDAPVVTFFHAYDLTTPEYRQRNVYRRLFAAGDLFLAISDHARQLMIGLGCPEERIRIHHMGVDCGRFTYRARRYGGGPIRVLSVGRMVEKKGYMHGLSAISHVVDMGVPVEYTIVGDGPQLADIEAAVTSLGLRNHVRLLGWQPQEAVLELMYEHHLLMMPSVTAANGDEEGVPVTLMEAMATGLPVVATRHAGIPELVQDGRSGILVPEDDVVSLADALSRLARIPQEWPTLGLRGRRIVESEYDIAVLNRTLADILVEVISQNDRQTR